MNKNKLLIVGMAVAGVVAVVMMIMAITDSLKTPEAPPLTPDTGGGGFPTVEVLCDDGARVPAERAMPLMVDGVADPYKFQVAGHGTGYLLYECAQTGKVWPYGKDGQITSPFYTPE